MALLSFEKSDNKINFFLFGIRICFNRTLHLLFGNKIFILKKNGKLKRVFWVRGIKFRFLGTGAVCILPEQKIFKNCFFTMFKDSYIEIKTPQSNWIDNLHIEVLSGSKVSIGENCKIIGTHIYSGGVDGNVAIGNDCMFSNNTLIRTHDGHALFDVITKMPINPPASVYLGNHVWIAKNALILKGVKLLDNTIVATGAIVAKSCTESNVVLAGNPALVVKTNVNWDLRNCDQFLKDAGECYA